VLDRAVNELIGQAQARAAGILRENRALLETLRDLLLEKKTLDAKTLGAMAPAKPGREPNDGAGKAPRRKKANV
jgi:ATP-dependent Zn protease